MVNPIPIGQTNNSFTRNLLPSFQKPAICCPRREESESFVPSRFAAAGAAWNWLMSYCLWCSHEHLWARPCTRNTKGWIWEPTSELHLDYSWFHLVLGPWGTTIYYNAFLDKSIYIIILKQFIEIVWNRTVLVAMVACQLTPELGSNRF